MRKICLVFLGLFVCIENVDAAVRVQQNNETIQNTRQTTNRSRTSVAQQRTVTVRPNTTQRKSRSLSARTSKNNAVSVRSTTKRQATRTPNQTPTVSRAATQIQPQSFGTSYNACRDAYFVCMDQFCATQNENYRRCICSSKLQSIKQREQTLSQTVDSLKNFDAFNISIIDKTSDEVHAMINASDGEKSIRKDKSGSAMTLQNISAVLDDSKKKSLSTHGKLDIAGNIKSIWATTNLIGGADIANLTGESLYNAVHTQCSELVTENCSATDLKMVASAYGMYIENDCSLLQANLDTQQTNTNSAIRETRQKLQNTRLENYAAHNSASINDCISSVRQDITSDSACGAGYIHCLDFSGKYINITTGEPIYSPEFYQIESQISLSDDILNDSHNATFMNMLDKKRSFAEQSLNACQENADEVWQEFLKQALVEIYQAQQERVQSVKKECLGVVNTCYLKQSEQLKNFVSTDAQINIGQTLELSEEMCADKLNACGNLYGGGDNGLNVLVATMTSITDITIEQTCPQLLESFVEKLCAVSVNDSAHSAPYGCRTYAPGEARYAQTEKCNTTLINPFSKTSFLLTNPLIYGDFSSYTNACATKATKIYKECKYGYYLYTPCLSDSENQYCYSEKNATECHKCPATALCNGGSEAPTSIYDDNNLYFDCGEFYIGSLYQQLTRYALQNCGRPSTSSGVPSKSLLTDIDTIMNKTRTELVIAMSKECVSQSGIWIDIPWVDNNGDGTHDSTGDILHNGFYMTTGSNAQWGYCKQ